MRSLLLLRKSEVTSTREKQSKFETWKVKILILRNSPQTFKSRSKQMHIADEDTLSRRDE